MTRSIARLVATLVLLAFSAATATAVQRPYIVVDLDSGKVLAERNPYQLWYAASVTKLMNAYVTFKALRAGRVSLTTEVIVTQHALDEPPSKMGFKVGTIITLDNALKMMLVHSANDIAMAVGETVGGSEAGFVAMMNAEAQRLGMSSTRYVNPNGLPGPGQQTTARDLAVLTAALWKDFPEQHALFGIPAIRFGNRVMRSENTLLERYHGTVGMKTGFICSSGFNIVATAQRDGHTLAAVVLGADSPKDRAELTARLLNLGFGMTALAGFRPSLANFNGASPVPEPIDMRQQICLRKRGAEPEDTDDSDDRTIMATALDPRFQLMDPVDVHVAGLRAPDGSVNTAVSEADVVPAPPPARVKKVRKPKKPAAVAKSATKTVEPTADSTGSDTASAPAAKPAAAKPAAKPAAKASAKKKPKIEIGVPFNASDIAPSANPAAPTAE